MKIFCWIVFIGLDFYLLFILSKRYDRALLMKVFPALVPVILVIAVIMMFVMKFAGFHPDGNFKNYFFSVVFSLIVICLINLANQFFQYALDQVTGFHQTQNAANINRQPVKFFISYKETLRHAATIVWFLGSGLMLYGIWLGKR